VAGSCSLSIVISRSLNILATATVFRGEVCYVARRLLTDSVVSVADVCTVCARIYYVVDDQPLVAHNCKIMHANMVENTSSCGQQTRPAAELRPIA